MFNIIGFYKLIKNRISGNHTARSVFENSGWQVANSVFNMVLGVFVTGIVARYFGPTVFGQLNYAVAFISLFTAVANLGLETLTVKNIVDETWNEGTILCTSFMIRVAGGSLLTVLAYIIIRIIEPDNFNIHILVLIMSITMIIKAFEVLEYWIQAYQKAKVSSKIRMVSYVLICLIKILIVLSKGNIIQYAIIYLVDSLIVGTALIITYFRIRENKTKWKIDIKYAKYILSQSWYFILSGLMVSLYNRIDQVMLGSMLTNKAETGVYSAAVSIAEMWYFVPMAIIVSFKPIIMQKKNINQDYYKKSVQILYDIITAISLSFGVLITIFSKIIVAIIYGANYSESSNILVILVWAGTFAMLGTSRSIWLVSEGLQKYSMFYTFIGCLVNIPLNIILIPYYGAYGAAIATLLAQFFNIASLSLFKETRLSTKMIFNSFKPKEIIKSVRYYIYKENV